MVSRRNGFGQRDTGRENGRIETVPVPVLRRVIRFKM
jgi:hypothetical protein